MYEPKEIVNMVASLAFFVYFFYLVRKGRCNRIPEIWLYGVFLVTIGNLATVAEGFFLPVFLNYTEHISFTVACFLFLIGVVQLKPEKVV
jgi:hypothetical protein